MMTNAHFIRIALLGAAVATATPAIAQQPAKDKKGQQAEAAAPAQPAVKKADLPTPPPDFAYAPEGRRDPFLSLVARGDDGTGDSGEATKQRAEGVPGMLAGELFVRGIVQTRGSWVAMVSGADKKVYTVRSGDKLADGVIRQITANSVVILQEVNDPLSVEKQREVRKFLRGGGDEVK